MPHNNRALGGAGVAVLLLAASCPARAEPAAAPPGVVVPQAADDSLDAIRAQAVAAARAAQRDERAVARIEHDTGLIESDLAARQRGLSESRLEQARLLGNIELLQRNPPDPAAFADERPLDRIRSEMLVEGLVPELRARARALGTEFARIRELGDEIATEKRKLDGAEATLAAARRQIADLGGKRLAAMRRMLPIGGNGISDAESARLARTDKDVGALIADAEAALANRDKALARQRKTDPTEPAEPVAFDPPQSALVPPVSGAIERPFGADGADGTASRGLDMSVVPGAVVVAPFDGRVVFAGKFQDFGLVLIMRHGARYHSLLAGLGRIGVRSGQWLLAGEPVGAMPDGPHSDASAANAGDGADGHLYFELRRDGRPVDPQPWLASHDERGDAPNGDQRVRE